MLNLDPSKLLVIAVLAIVLLGPEKLPTAARSLGLAWRSLSRWRERVEAEMRSTLPDLPSTQDLNQMLRNPATLLNRLALHPEGATTLGGPAESIAVPDDPPGAQIAASFVRPRVAPEVLNDAAPLVRR